MKTAKRAEESTNCLDQPQAQMIKLRKRYINVLGKANKIEEEKYKASTTFYRNKVCQDENTQKPAQDFVAHLPKHKQVALEMIRDLILRHVKAAMIMLLGSYARGEWVEDSRKR